MTSSQYTPAPIAGYRSSSTPFAGKGGQYTQSMFNQRDELSDPLGFDIPDDFDDGMVAQSVYDSNPKSIPFLSPDDEENILYDNLEVVGYEYDSEGNKIGELLQQKIPEADKDYSQQMKHSRVSGNFSVRGEGKREVEAYINPPEDIHNGSTLAAPLMDEKRLRVFNEVYLHRNHAQDPPEMDYGRDQYDGYNVKAHHSAFVRDLDKGHREGYKQNPRMVPHRPVGKMQSSTTTHFRRDAQVKKTKENAYVPMPNKNRPERLSKKAIRYQSDGRPSAGDDSNLLFGSKRPEQRQKLGARMIGEGTKITPNSTVGIGGRVSQKERENNKRVDGVKSSLPSVVVKGDLAKGAHRSSAKNDTERRRVPTSSVPLGNRVRQTILSGDTRRQNPFPHLSMSDIGSFAAKYLGFRVSGTDSKNIVERGKGASLNLTSKPMYETVRGNARSGLSIFDSTVFGNAPYGARQEQVSRVKTKYIPNDLTGRANPSSVQEKRILPVVKNVSKLKAG